MIGRSAVRRLLAALVATAGLWAAIAPAGALAANPKVSVLTVEANVMCLSCHEPLELAQSPQAQAEKNVVKGLVAQGLTLHQIEQQLVAQYGVAVLGRPPASGFNLTVYILPPAVLLLGAAILLYTLPKWRERSRRAAAHSPPVAPPLERADAERLDEDLARFV